MFGKNDENCHDLAKVGVVFCRPARCGGFCEVTEIAKIVRNRAPRSTFVPRRARPPQRLSTLPRADERAACVAHTLRTQSRSHRWAGSASRRGCQSNDTVIP